VMSMTLFTQNDDNFPLLTESGKSAPTATSTARTAVPTDDQWGIDTIELSFDVNADLSSIDDSLWTSQSTRIFADSKKSNNSLVGTLHKEFADVRVTLFIDRAICKLQFNAARLLTPVSPNLLPPSAIQPLVIGILDDIQSAVVPIFDVWDSTGTISRGADWVDHMRVVRIDNARNFYLDDPQSVKKALMNAKPLRNKLNHCYWDSKGGWTLANGSKQAGMDRIYDKAAELAQQKAENGFTCAAGTYRFEAQLRKERLQRAGMTKLSGVTDENVWKAIKMRWDDCHWGVLLPEIGTLKKAVEPLSVANQESLLGYLYLAERGWTDGMSASHIRNRDALAKSVGLIPGMPLAELGAPSRQLDLWAGKIIDI
jgi:hypothetical protein